MNTQSSSTVTMQAPMWDHAVVIGGSIAGMTTARVLADHFARVTIIERDRLPDGPEFRRGAPQARHAHILLVRGQMILEGLFPGMVEELLAGGAETVNAGNEWEFFLFDNWRRPQYESKLVLTGCSRALLEHVVRRHILKHPRIEIIQEHEVSGLCTDIIRTRATGVRIRSRVDAHAPEQELSADLVVDASGRDSHAPQWLESLGFTPPTESVVNSFPGYATRIYQRPANFNESWKTMYVMPTPTGGSRGAVILPMEGNRWQVTLIGMGRDYPPIDEEGFMAFARSLPTPRFAEALQAATPLGEAYGYRRAENRLRHYDQMPRYLENFLVAGDAVYALNPVYGQGMTLAALGGETLASCIEHQRHDKTTLIGLAKVFQKELGKMVAAPWQLATGEDRRWAATEGAGELDRMTKLVQSYMNRVLHALVYDQDVAETFFNVQHMVKSPATLFHPRIVWKVLRSNWQTKQEQRPTAVSRPVIAPAAGD